MTPPAPTIKEVAAQIAKVHALFQDAHPGLATWIIAIDRELVALHKMLDAIDAHFGSDPSRS